MIKTLNYLDLKKIFLLAILIRILIIPFYFHPDIKTYHFQSQFLKQGVFNIYDYLQKNKESLPSKEEFVYFPLTYIFLGGYQVLTHPFLGEGFNNWLNDASQESAERVGVFRYLFILKIPYLILDLAIAFLIIRFFKDRESQRKAFILWLFNPISISIIYIFSNVDIISVFLSLISILLLRNQKIFLSALILGLSAGFKPFTLLFLPILLFYCKDLKQSLKYAAVSFGTLFLIIVPFWSGAFFHSALLSGLTTRIAYPGIPIGFGEALMVGVVALAGLFFWIFINKDKGEDKLIFYILSLLLLLFSTIHFHIQWLLWIMPVLIISAVLVNRISSYLFLWLSVVFLIPLLYNDQAMNVSLLSTISLVYKSLPTVFTFVQRVYEPQLLQSLLHSIAFALSLVLVVTILKGKKS